MIYIKSLKLTNFGRHESINEDFSGHVVGLTGPNGRGKSTILQGLQFALTGTIDTDPVEPLKNFIKQSSGPKPPKYAEVEVDFMVDGKEGKIIRRITRTSSTRKLWWDGAKKPITTEAKTAAIMEEILGVDKKAINSTVFIRQGEMDSMFGKEADRRDFYARLLRLGHLPKIANIIDNYRAHQADSVQDLGAIRDAAESTYNEARVYFETTEEALGRCPSQEEDLKIGRRVVALFEDQAEAGEALERAEAAIATYLSGDEDNVERWITDQRDRLASAIERRDSLNQQRATHLTWSKAVRDAEKEVEELDRTTHLFSVVREIETELKDKGEIGPDPAPEVERLKTTLTKIDRKVELEKSLPADRSHHEQLVERLATATQAVKDKEEVYNGLKEIFAVTKSNRDMRQALAKSLEHDHSEEECPLCYSKTKPDQERLEADLKADVEHLADVERRGKEAGQALATAKDEYDSVSRSHQSLSESLGADEKELRRLGIELSLFDQATVEKDLAAAQEAQKAYAAAEFEVNRLKKDLAEAQKAVEGKTIPTQTENDEAATSLEEATKGLASAPWSDVEEQEAKAAAEEATTRQEAIDKIQKEAADLKSAQERSKELTTALAKAVSEIPDGFYDDFRSGDAGLTSEEAAAKVEALEAKQQEHDEARGRKDAANERLKDASRKVDELELRTAEQKHRLKLVKDLERLRDTFKPSGASLEYLNYRFGEIARMAGDYLAESGADFMVSPSEEVPLCFEFLRTDRENEVWLPQNRLSGGQKVRLAVATLRAIHALVMPDVGLMVLDEPTTHLDDEVKRSMADMLNKIGEEGTLQMVVCDHSPIMVDAFSDTIEIPE